MHESVRHHHPGRAYAPARRGIRRASYSVGTFAGQLSALYNDWLYDDSASDFFIWNGQLLAYKGESKTPVIPDTVQTIGADAFWRTDITGVTIPAGVREIGPSAFYESTALTAVDIPGSVARIDNSAFSGCTPSRCTRACRSSATGLSVSARG